MSAGCWGWVDSRTYRSKGLNSFFHLSLKSRDCLNRLRCHTPITTDDATPGPSAALVPSSARNGLPDTRGSRIPPCLKSSTSPPVSTDLLEDDAASAGIVRSRTTRSHRWFLPKQAVRGEPAADAAAAAAVGGSLRRIIRPPLEKARSLFVMPMTTMAGEQVVVSCWLPLAQEVGAVIAAKGEDGVGDRVGYLTVEKNHRRCHSEQPRSWRAPSASLWTLLEE
ncbi:uncharacterized protein ACLA_073720 [Aspergillus clavatus NRRL 1]|uniref:Uncharacterized protein n=1 Tax=Aspergillus clavatus (strain ATCC 1007 / CBS 513.65 / DSM 816 / NCTC 3887 / NRRL 1 / QM 1276 / 107) TaxID=344612 RepID=A1C7G6_ASPCL|nr:uncharacterized protein ACLA_073720 [Aspergillus clavatus NRRL 1]EAW14337.1 conserved hypothetical protein [Aspergillus clavatus NRRL 1]